MAKFLWKSIGLAVAGWLAFMVNIAASAQYVSSADSSKIDALFAKWNATDSPGCAISIMRDGQIVYKHAYGMANLDHNVIITTDTPFHVASISKQFTAASIVLLEQEGKLSLDDDVRKYIPELPDFGAKITIRNLLHHTSGLRDQFDLLGFAGWRYSLDLITNDDVLSLVMRQKELNFAPGSEYSYSNTGFTLLGEIVRRVSGKSLREFTTDRLFAPLGMKHTHFRDDHAEIIRNQAYGYSLDKKGWRLSVTNFDTVGATSLFTTVEDLALWDENFYTQKVGGSQFTETMLHHDPLTNGESIPYAFGLITGKYRGLDIVEHSGEDAGYRAYLLRFPLQHFSVACLCNGGDTIGPEILTKKIADILLAGIFGDAGPIDMDEKSVRLTAEQISAKSGYYIQKEKGDDIWHVVMKDNNLGMEYAGAIFPLHAYSAEKFRLGEFPGELIFTAGANGLFELKVGMWGEKMTSYTQLAPYKLPDSQRKQYAGEYRSTEIDPLYLIKEQDGKLVLNRFKYDPDILEAVAPDLFRAKVGTIRFERNERKAVIGMLLTTSGTRNLRFAKLR